MATSVQWALRKGNANYGAACDQTCRLDGSGPSSMSLENVFKEYKVNGVHKLISRGWDQNSCRKNIALPLKLGTRIQSMGRVWSYFMTCNVRIMLGEETGSIDQIPDSDLNISGFELNLTK